MNSVEITAHRGSSAKTPENTLVAFRQAIEDGCDYIELDVQACADGNVVVLHDSDLMRVAGDPRRVEDLTLSQLKQIDVGRWFAKSFVGENIPTLAEVIRLVRGRVRLNIELKCNRPDPKLGQAVRVVLRKERFLDQCVITSQDPAVVGEFQAAEPRVPTGLIVTGAAGRDSQMQADFLSVVASKATPAFIRNAHQAGKPVHVWTVNRPQAMLRMIENGADNVITDKPDVLRSVLEKRMKDF